MSTIDQGLAFIFPGQGSQSIGMFAELAESFAEVRGTFAEASDVLGYDLWDIAQAGPEEKLNSTLYTQPAMLAAGVAAWRVWCSESPVRPAFMAGHSLGEYTALVCAGSLSFPAGLLLVAERARRMQEAVPGEVGAMAALLGLDDDKVLDVCAAASGEGGGTVSAANFNAPGQVVIAGHRGVVAQAIELAKAAGAKRAVLLPVSVPSHCGLMKPAAEQFKIRLHEAEFAMPAIRVVHNDSALASPDVTAIGAALERQLYSPVRWTDSIRYIAGQGVDRFVECGPGRVLSGLNKRIVPGIRTESIHDVPSLTKAKELIS
jgi:[acyl-carrier-protein] S-malonyltransferase